MVFDPGPILPTHQQPITLLSSSFNSTRPTPLHPLRLSTVPPHPAHMRINSPAQPIALHKAASSSIPPLPIHIETRQLFPSLDRHLSGWKSKHLDKRSFLSSQSRSR
ncbi:hypothetical protein K435DRAFT_289453 [Dendrothele bispora CBS 962.96]|uniref:Uncharacterized protein n=1 Tax=Dendrothele bispora (strain CBS 962.96) TaxID=1314807 RepID=A0A4S8LKE5_DENBC|nr:hypothetical protein K435DRAFT_289453 [Dendrothele bispora CBS 962.96]